MVEEAGDGECKEESGRAGEVSMRGKLEDVGSDEFGGAAEGVAEHLVPEGAGERGRFGGEEGELAGEG